MTSVHYDRHGQVVGYSLPLWAVILKWLVIVAIITGPITATAAALGLGHSPVVAVIAMVWLFGWLAWWQHQRERRQLPPGQ